MQCIEYGWVWGFSGNDGRPAPYFDNIRLSAYEKAGPSIAMRAVDMSNDGFPEIGYIDLDDLSLNSVRFDMANNISQQTHLRNDPGDSIVFDVTIPRAAATLERLPRLYYSLDANPLFDTYRTSGLPNDGYVVCDSVRNAAGVLVPNRYFGDLPDDYFLFRFRFTAGKIWYGKDSGNANFRDSDTGQRYRGRSYRNEADCEPDVCGLLRRVR